MSDEPTMGEILGHYLSIPSPWIYPAIYLAGWAIVYRVMGGPRNVLEAKEHHVGPAFVWPIATLFAVTLGPPLLLFLGIGRLATLPTPRQRKEARLARMREKTRQLEAELAALDMLLDDADPWETFRRTPAKVDP